MSISTELQNYETYLQSTYDILADLGATMPANKNMQNVPIILEEFLLPYVKYSYIEGTGSQYMSTNYKPKSNTVFKFKIRLIGSNPTIDYERIYDCYNGSQSQGKIQRSNTSTTWGIQVYQTGVKNVVLTQEVDHVFEIGNSSVTVDGDTTSFPAITYTATYPLVLWKGNDRYGKFRLYYFQIYEGTELVHDYIPVKRRSDDKICMYDKVAQQFLVGVGTFTGAV